MAWDTAGRDSSNIYGLPEWEKVSLALRSRYICTSICMDIQSSGFLRFAWLGAVKLTPEISVGLLAFVRLHVDVEHEVVSFLEQLQALHRPHHLNEVLPLSHEHVD